MTEDETPTEESETERLFRLPSAATASRGRAVHRCVHRALRPHLAGWLRIVFRVIGGFIVAAGALMSYVAVTSFREGRRRAFVIVLLAGTVSMGWMVGVNFAIASDFRWIVLALALPLGGRSRPLGRRTVTRSRAE
jgi:MFS family permease